MSPNDPCYGDLVRNADGHLGVVLAVGAESCEVAFGNGLVEECPTPELATVPLTLIPDGARINFAEWLKPREPSPARGPGFLSLGPPPMSADEFTEFLGFMREYGGCVTVPPLFAAFMMTPAQARMFAVHLLNFARAIDGLNWQMESSE